MDGVGAEALTRGEGTSSAPPETGGGRHSVVTLPHQWFIACRSEALRGSPVAARLQGHPLVLFRDAAGRAAALEDRCPHRNVPLSAGRLRGGELECAYHGWRFDGRGVCTAVPGLDAPPSARAAQATAFACREQDGYVWIYSTLGAEPRRAPFAFPHQDDARYATVRQEFEVESTLLAALENTLDVPHTAFLHRGLFRTGRRRNAVDVVVRRWADRCEAEYVGEPRPSGLVGRLLAPRGGVVTHFDRFLLPSIAQVEYRLGEESHVVVTSAMTPLDDLHTRLFSAVTFRLPLPAAVVRRVLTPVATRIFAQDARVLALQTANVRRFGGERFASTELDVLGPQIWKLLRQAERAGDDAQPSAAARRDGEAAEHEHRVRMQV